MFYISATLYSELPSCIVILTQISCQSHMVAIFLYVACIFSICVQIGSPEMSGSWFKKITDKNIFSTNYYSFFKIMIKNTVFDMLEVFTKTQQSSSLAFLPEISVSKNICLTNRNWNIPLHQPSIKCVNIYSLLETRLFFFFSLFYLPGEVQIQVCHLLAPTRWTKTPHQELTLSNPMVPPFESLSMFGFFSLFNVDWEISQILQ